MKRVGYIYEKIYDKDNLREAIIKASNNKTHKKIVRHILYNPDLYVQEIHDQLKNQTITFLPAEGKEGSGGPNKKKRFITAPAFYPNQIVHWALMLQIQPIIERGMYYYNCGSIPEKGIKMALNYVERMFKKHNPRYALTMDIKKFFQSVSTDKMLELFSKKIKDKKVLNLIDLILENGGPGLPIGFFTSQWFSNFYLEELDHYIKEDLKIPHYVRYMDNMILMSNNKRKLHQAKRKIDAFLKNNDFEITIKEDWQVFPTRSRAVDFVGYKISYKDAKIRKHIFYKMHKRARSLAKRKTLYNARSYMSVRGWFKPTTHSEHYVQKHLEPIINTMEVRKYIGRMDKYDLHRKSSGRKRTSKTSRYNSKNYFHTQKYKKNRNRRPS